MNFWRWGRPLDGQQNFSESQTDETSLEYRRGFYHAVMRKPEIYDDDPPFWQTFFRSLIFMSVPMGLLYFFQRSMMREIRTEGKGLMSMLIDPPRNFLVTSKSTTFKDVIGLPQATEELRLYVDFLRNPGKFITLGARLPRGCLLTGPPGTGKTLLAKAVAGEANVPFLSCSGSDFVEVFLGSGPKTVRKLFQEARDKSPCIVFIDEIDAVGARGRQSTAGSSQEENRTINQLLMELDGLTTSSSTIIVLAATNFVENVDGALLREGRFDRKVDLPLPDPTARQQLFYHFLCKVVTGDPRGKQITNEYAVEKNKLHPTQGFKTENLPPNVKNNSQLADIMSQLTPGLSPATIASVVNEAALAAASRNESIVALGRLKEAVDDVTVGRRSPSRLSTAGRKRVALHECGHALTAWLLPEQRPVTKISIIPRGPAGGFTQQEGREALDPTTRMEMFTNLCVLLGGRCGESLHHRNLTTGATDDLQKATKQCIAQLLTLGMSPSVGSLSFNPQVVTRGRLFVTHSSTLQHRAETVADDLINLALQITTELLEDHRKELFTLQNELLEHNELSQEQVTLILGARPKGSLFSAIRCRHIHNTYDGKSVDSNMSSAPMSTYS